MAERRTPALRAAPKRAERPRWQTTSRRRRAARSFLVLCAVLSVVAVALSRSAGAPGKGPGSRSSAQRVLRVGGSEPAGLHRVAHEGGSPEQTRSSTLSSALSRLIPAEASQAIIVTSPSFASDTNRLTLWQRSDGHWQSVGASIPGYNGLRGWSSDRVEGDLRTPTGVYTLTYAGGRLPNPGTHEPYEYSPSYFDDDDATFLGKNLRNVFNYVVAIDFNRVPGTPPSSTIEPDGPGPGGGIWLHVSDGTGTEGCVTVSQSDMATILRWLNPALHPVIVLRPSERDDGDLDH
jgi:L,D-peptidoglycan transpeptidase YkuD (ErfK/YbiS/YcfS/YnhG family)